MKEKVNNQVLFDQVALCLSAAIIAGCLSWHTECTVKLTTMRDVIPADT